MERAAWLAANRAAVEQRLEGLIDKPPGTLFFEPSGDHFVVVDKVGSQLRLWLADPGADLVQSRLDLRDPLYPLSPYTQAVLLALAWNTRPDRIFIAGLGGGRVPFILHHYLPEAGLECAEIDAVVIKAATCFFGLRPDARLQVACQDAREYLARQGADVRYDLILIDAFLGSGDGPYHLATKEFYRLCRRHLSDRGVIIANLLHHDSLLSEKVKTIQSMFEHIYFWPPGRGNGLVFGTCGPGLSRETLMERVVAIQADYHFPFPFVRRAEELKIEPEVSDCVPGLEEAWVLLDTA